MHQHLFPGLVLATVTTDRNTALRGLHTVGIIISTIRQCHQLAVMLQTLFHQWNSGIQFIQILSPLIVQDTLSSFHFQVKGISKFTIAMHVIPQTSELLFITSHRCGSLVNGRHRLVTVFHHLRHNIQRQFAHMRLFLPFLLHIFYQLLTLRPATLIKSRINGIFIRIHQLAHKHTQQQSLPVPFRDAETTEQLRSNLSTLLVCLQNISSFGRSRTIIITQLLVPIFHFR